MAELLKFESDDELIGAISARIDDIDAMAMVDRPVDIITRDGSVWRHVGVAIRFCNGKRHLFNARYGAMLLERGILAKLGIKCQFLDPGQFRDFINSP